MIQKTSEIPFLYVTHNISEVIRIGSYMYVLHDGKVIQEGTPLHVFSSPSTLKIAKLVGTENIFVGKVASHKIQEGLTVLDLGGSMLEVPYNKIEIGSQVTIGIRSEDIIITLDPRTQTSARNMLEGKVVDIMHGAEGVELIVNCGVNFKVSVTPAAIKQMNIRVGSTVYILVKARACYLLA